MKYQILVLDDDTTELRKLREILTKEGFNIITATNKETANELSRHIDFGYVIGNASILGFSSKDITAGTINIKEK